MGSTIEFTSRFDAKKEVVNLIDGFEKILEKEMQEAAGEIVRRSQRGETVSGGRMKQYSKSYKRYKESLGRSGQVDLTLSGQMLTALVAGVEYTKTSVTGVIYFLMQRSNRGIGGKGSTATNSQLAEWNDNIRPFFALSKKQIDKIINALQRK